MFVDEAARFVGRGRDDEADRFVYEIGAAIRSLHWVPNAVSLSRLLLGIAFPMLPADWRLPVVILAAVTDGVDGQLSRWMHAESKFGVLLDPIADKIFFLAVVATLLWDGSITWLELILVSLRDVIVVLGGIGAWMRDGGVAWQQMKPRWPGKVVTVLQFAFIAAVLLEPGWSDAAGWRTPVLVATAIVGALSGIDYVWAYVTRNKP